MTFEEYAALDETERMKLAISQLSAVASVQSGVSLDEPDTDKLTLKLDVSDDEEMAKETALLLKEFRRFLKSMEEENTKGSTGLMHRFGNLQLKLATKPKGIRRKFGSLRLKPIAGSKNKTRA